MKAEAHDWLPLPEAAKHFGYQHVDSIRHRLRQLRKQGRVVDLGSPPAEYQAGKRGEVDKIVIYWPNPNTALMRSDAPAEYFIPKRGRRVPRRGGH